MATEGDRLDELMDLEDALFDLEEALDTAMSTARDVARMADRMMDHPGETGLIAPQLRSYLIPTLQTFIDSEHQIGAIVSLRETIEEAKDEVEQEDRS